MSQTKQELIHYRIKRAKESLEEAKLLAKNDHWNATVNRLYYACFYIVSALLIANNLNAKTHTGTRALFNQHFIKEQEVDKELGEFYAKLFDKRQQGDYEDFEEFSEDEVQPYISEAENFIKVIEAQIKF